MLPPSAQKRQATLPSRIESDSYQDEARNIVSLANASAISPIHYRKADLKRESLSRVFHSNIPLPWHDLRCLHGAHLADPRGRGLDLADGAQFVGRVARDADIVRALQHELDVADLQHLGPALLSVTAGRGEHAIDERVGEV